MAHDIRAGYPWSTLADAILALSAPTSGAGSGEQVDGVIKNARIRPSFGGAGGNVAEGNLYGARNNRFPDGMAISTSFITSGPDENGIIRTRDSVYRLELSAAPSSAEVGAEVPNHG